MASWRWRHNFCRPPPNPLHFLPRRIPSHPNGSKPRLRVRLLLQHHPTLREPAGNGDVVGVAIPGLTPDERHGPRRGGHHGHHQEEQRQKQPVGLPEPCHPPHQPRGGGAEDRGPQLTG